MQTTDSSTANEPVMTRLIETLLAEQRAVVYQVGETFDTKGDDSGKRDSSTDGRRGTAVERFASFHESRETHETDDASGPELSADPRRTVEHQAEEARRDANGTNFPESPATNLYHDLIPLSSPREGEQYAFEVDLDACTGCKACVTACHNLNGLEDDELWRSVGLLHGGGQDSPALQHVTTSCHHCLEPGCLEGCPVNAYEKDPTTGVVVHLDDQCIGCQYCMLKCPYDVPQFSRSKGIVRKCDMCRQRLAVDQAPACVEACPNGAIRIRIVDLPSIVDACQAEQFLPGAPSPGYTLPTTVYKSARPLPRNMMPADYYTARPQHGHLALVVMLVLTQMSVGAFVVEQWLYLENSPADLNLALAIRPAHLAAALASGLLGLGASIFHLGRPRYAYRALLGLRHSWLSREILCFGLFATSAAAYVACGLSAWTGGRWAPVQASPQLILGMVSVGLGMGAVACSVFIYADTPRPFWSGPRTAVKFYLTTAVLGLAVALVVCVTAAAVGAEATVQEALAVYGRPLCRWLVVVAFAKLAFESAIFLHLVPTSKYARQRLSPLARTAVLMAGPLSVTVLKRYFCGALGGIVLPLVLLGQDALAGSAGFHPLFVMIVALLMLALLLAGELLERYLFFAASAAPRMPGGGVA